MPNSPSITVSAQKPARGARRPWKKPRVARIVAGSAEAISRDGQPDGGPVGQSRS